MTELPSSVLTWLRMSRFVHTSDQISNAHLERFGLSIAQFELLAHVQAFEPITQGRLAQGLTLSNGSVSRMVARLERDGLLARQQEWKTKYLTLTPRGREVFEQAYPAQVALQTSLFDQSLTPAELKQLNALVKKLYDHGRRVRAALEPAASEQGAESPRQVGSPGQVEPPKQQASEEQDASTTRVASADAPEGRE